MAGASNGQYVELVRSVKSINDMDLWMNSAAKYDIISFIKRINVAVQGKKLSTKLIPSRTADNLLHIFDTLNKMINETPPIHDKESYCNWFEKMRSTSTKLLKEALPVIFHPELIEVSAYFTESFGNATRIDYGHCHEFAFIMFLCALYKIKALSGKDDLYVGLKIFNAYLQVVRQLQLTYGIEPAGSHGVSSMCDYQYLSYIWGSAQLSVKEPFEPSRFLETDVIKRYKNEYYFIGCIDHVRQVKPGSFAELSNQLSSICSIYSWARINSILIGKYERELLKTFPVIRHLLFGSILELKETSCLALTSSNQVLLQRIDWNLQQLNKSSTIWEMISSQLVWLITLLCSGWFSNHSALILWLAWCFWLIWLIFRICHWALNTFNRLTPPPSPE